MHFSNQNILDLVENNYYYQALPRIHCVPNICCLSKNIHSFLKKCLISKWVSLMEDLMKVLVFSQRRPCFCQAQSRLQLSWTELALISH